MSKYITQATETNNITHNGFSNSLYIYHALIHRPNAKLLIKKQTLFPTMFFFTFDTKIPLKIKSIKPILSGIQGDTK